MTKEGNIFSITIELESGDYAYKFLLNGTDWICDPLNSENLDGDGNSMFSVTAGTSTDKPETPDNSEAPDNSETPDTEDKQPSGDKPAGTTSNNDGVIILISAIITIVVVLGGYVAFLFIKKKNAK